ncbi:MAG: RidA family protein [Bacteroidota bacterium]
MNRADRKLWILMLLAILIALIPWFVLAQGAPPLQKEKYNANKASEDQYGYTQAVKAGNTIYISGHAARGPMGEAVKKTYEALEKTLAHYGATFQHVVKENIYTTQYDELLKHVELRKSFYRNDYPASTWVQIDRLFNPEVVLEVELIAVLPD